MFTTTYTENNDVTDQAQVVRTNQKLGEVLGATLAILILLLALSFAGLLYVYKKVKISETGIQKEEQLVR